MPVLQTKIANKISFGELAAKESANIVVALLLQGPQVQVLLAQVQVLLAQVQVLLARVLVLLAQVLVHLAQALNQDRVLLLEQDQAVHQDLQILNLEPVKTLKVELQQIVVVDQRQAILRRKSNLSVLILMPLRTSSKLAWRAHAFPHYWIVFQRNVLQILAVEMAYLISENLVLLQMSLQKL